MKGMLKNTGKILGLILFSSLLAGNILRAEEAKNLLSNPGFENIEPFTVPEQWQGKVEASEMPKDWIVPPSSPGKLTVIYDAITSHGGSKYVKLEPLTARWTSFRGKGKNWQIPVSPNKRYVVKVWAKGNGSIAISMYGYSKRRGGKFIPGFGSGWMEVNSPDNWKEYKFEFSTSSKPKIKSTTVTFSTKGTIYLDDAYFAPLPANE